MMHNVPEADSRAYIETADGYMVSSDYGRLGGGTDVVHLPPHDPEAAAKTRREINAVLARYGYRLADEEVSERQSNETSAG